MGGGRLTTVVKRAVAARETVQPRGLEPRSRGAGVWASLWTRVARVVIWSVRGLFVHNLSLQAAALAYYTLFSIVPVLVVALWVLKLFHLIPYLKPAEAQVAAVTTATPAQQHVRLRPQRSSCARRVRAILAAVDRAGRVQIGIVGLGALLYGVIKLIRHMEAGDRHHRRRGASGRRNTGGRSAISRCWCCLPRC